MISVCMATYNGEKYIREQLSSILHQIGPSDEVIVSDDSSTDSTVEIVRSFNDSRVRLLINQEFHSPIFNFQNAIAHSKGDFIFLSDQDDIWDANKVKVMLPLLERYDMVHSDARVIDSESKLIKEHFHNAYYEGSFLKSFIKNPYLGCTIAINRRALAYLLPFPEGIAMHDIWIGLCCKLFGNVKYVNMPLISYRRHHNNTSPTGERSPYSIKYKITYRVYMLKELIRRGGKRIVTPPCK